LKGAIAFTLDSDMELALSYFSQQSDLLY